MGFPIVIVSLLVQVWASVMWLALELVSRPALELAWWPALELAWGPALKLDHGMGPRVEVVHGASGKPSSSVPYCVSAIC